MNVPEESGSWKIDGSKTPDLLIAGHSHILALLAAHAEWSRLSVQPQFAFIYSDDRSKWPQIADDYWDAVSTSSASTVAIVWNGNQHNAHFLLESSPPLRMAGVPHPPSEEPVETYSAVVSQSTFEELWRADFLSLERVVQQLSQTKRCILVGTPPPKDSYEIQTYLKSDAFFVQRAQEMGVPVDSLKVTSNQFRVALWKQIQNGLAAIAKNLQTEFVPVPSNCFNPELLLANGMGIADATHANEAYGFELLKAIAVQWRQNL